MTEVPSKERAYSIFAVRTTSGQERTAAYLLRSKAALKKLPVSAILVPEIIKGYVFIEAQGPNIIDELISGVRHARARTKGTISSSDIERFIAVKPVIEELSPEDLVEVVGGPFRGMKAKITHVDKVKEEVTIELLEESFTILPITVHADYVKLIEKGIEKHE
ncbi:MAG: transcription elongation factor Spt5 [Candidatus Bathyarchaeota archaeon]|nr:transcription elongation factor Spt5 [Candidatus Bathyarchaeota archaeon]